MKRFGLTKVGFGCAMSCLGGLLLALLGGISTGCGGNSGGSDPNGGQPDIHPRTLFETTVKPEMLKSCGCHTAAQGTVQAFLVPGMEYTSITTYKNGAFIVSPSVQSLLLTKGQHEGNPLNPTQYSLVQAWLDAENAYRGNMMKSPLLPTVPITAGTFNMSFQNLNPINDPKANITFNLTQDSNNIYRMTSLTLTAGPTTGIHIQHPIIYFISATKSFPDPADSLSTVDITIAASAKTAIGTGPVLLTNAPSNDPNTRIGIAFQLVQKAMPTTVTVQCKAFNLFNPKVKSDLTVCANNCHSNNGRNNVAYGAFDMGAANSTDPMMLMKFCADTLGRIDTMTPANSILLKQPTPVNMGGYMNHPYKLDNTTTTPTLMQFTNDVTAWATAEK